MVDARGESWKDLDLALQARKLQWADRGGALVLDGIELGVGFRDRKLTLEEAKLPRAQDAAAPEVPEDALRRGVAGPAGVRAAVDGRPAVVRRRRNVA